MSANPYAAPQAELFDESVPTDESLWRANGRVGVRTYWARQLVLGVAFLVPAAAIVAAGGLFAADANPDAINPIVVACGVLLMLPYLWLAGVVTARRLHDLGMSGWWMLLFPVPLVGMLFSLYATLKPGRAEANRFGGLRRTRGWENVLGSITLGLYALALISPLAALLFVRTVG